VFVQFCLVAPTASPIPIAIIQGAPDSIWGIASALAAGAAAIVTLVLAGATIWLALETRRMAQQTTALAHETRDSIAVSQDALSREDAHHQRSLWPFCVPHKAQECYGPASDVVLFTLDNIGPGYALYTQVFIESIDGTAYGFSSIVGPRGPNEKATAISRIKLNRTMQKNEMILRLDAVTMFGSAYESRWHWKEGDADWMFLDCRYPSIRPVDFTSPGVRLVDVTM
jgi:hypothetical protein